MRLVGTRPERLTTVPYRAAGPGGVPQNVQLGVERLPVDQLPAGCDAGDRRAGGGARPEVVAKLTTPPPDVLLLHEGPTGDRGGQLSRAVLRSALERRAPALTLCGHVHWAEPVAALGDGHVVNVDARVAVFTV
jgi:hypothetical protein